MLKRYDATSETDSFDAVWVSQTVPSHAAMTTKKLDNGHSGLVLLKLV